MLWTPNPKTVDPVKMCERCGGIDRRHYASDHRDTRRYLSLHRICCCDFCGSFDLEMVISGVDASICATCTQSSPTSSARAASMAIDGTYTGFADFGTLPNFQMRKFNNGTCTVHVWPSSGTCTGSPSSVTRKFRLAVNGVCENNEITSITSVGVGDVGSGEYSAFQWSGTASLGDTLNNANVCGVPIIADGGTVVVNLN